MRNLLIGLILLLGSMGAHAVVECQSLEDLDFIVEFPGFYCPEGYIAT